MSALLRGSALVLAFTVVLAACERGEEEREAAPDTAAVGEQPEQPMGGMPGMPRTQSGAMMGQMQSHMRMMQGMSADSTKAILPQHRQMVANMISQMNREMREMNMATDERWNATVDSLRQDLTRMPEMSGEELQAFMPEHGARVMRLMEMHRSMMRSMQR
jgi:nitrous oxide reductase accessory protein NosL